MNWVTNIARRKSEYQRQNYYPPRYLCLDPNSWRALRAELCLPSSYPDTTPIRVLGLEVVVIPVAELCCITATPDIEAFREEMKQTELAR